MIYSSVLYEKFHRCYCKHGLQEFNEQYFYRNISKWKSLWVNYLNIFFETFSIIFIRVYMRRKRIAKYIEIIPKLLTKNQRIRRTVGFIKKYWKLFSFERYELKKQKALLYRAIYKNSLNFNRWK